MTDRISLSRDESERGLQPSVVATESETNPDREWNQMKDTDVTGSAGAELSEGQCSAKNCQTTTIDLDNLERLARAATPGPWEQGTPSGKCHLSHQHGHGDCDYQYRIDADSAWARSQVCIRPNVTLIGTDDNGPVLSERNAAFIAAANPAVVLELVRRLRAAEELVAEYKDLAMDRNR